MKLSFLLLLSASLLLAQCKKHDPSPLEQLPPATQTGANTFGCLINGEAYTPNGFPGKPGFVVLYDPGFSNGSLDIHTYNYKKSGEQYLLFGSGDVNHIGTYILPTIQGAGVFFSDDQRANACAMYDSHDGITFCRGQFIITYLDYQAGIIAGTFAFTLYRPGCDSIRVTQGRFDKKL